MKNPYIGQMKSSEVNDNFLNQENQFSFPTIFKKINHILIPSFFCGLLLFCVGCCYTMPGDHCISTLPNTNNPHITGEKTSFIPGRG